VWIRVSPNASISLQIDATSAPAGVTCGQKLEPVDKSRTAAAACHRGLMKPGATDTEPHPPALPQPVGSVAATTAEEGLRFTPTARVMRRSSREIQIERGDRAVIVANMPEEVITGLNGSPGERRVPGASERPLDRAAVATSDDGDIARVLRALVGLGFLSPASVTGTADVDPGAWSVALAPDLAALGERFGARARTVLRGRQQRGVRVHGTGRLAPLIGALLAAAGIGEVTVPDSGDVVLRDAMPGGLLPADEGHRTAVAAADAVRRARPGGSTSTAPAREAELVIATEGLPMVPHLRAALLAAQSPHLVTGVWGSSAVIGPLVVPGHTSCLHCADLHRADRDPAWPALEAQLGRHRDGSTPSEIAVCALAAAVTVVQALAFLDGERPATADGTLEFRLPDWRLRRRHWSRHTDCPCAA